VLLATFFDGIQATYRINCDFVLKQEYVSCHYLILSVVPAAKNLKPLSWEAANRLVRTVKAKTLSSRCQYLPTEAAAALLHPEVQAAAGADAEDVPAPVAAVVTNRTVK